MLCIMLACVLLLLTFCMAAYGGPPRLLLGGNGSAQIEASGQQGDLITIEATSSLVSEPWEVLSSVLLTNSSIQWPDLWAPGSPRRFYRVTRAAAGELRLAPNFRLIDHLGKSRGLYYIA